MRSAARWMRDTLAPDASEQPDADIAAVPGDESPETSAPGAGAGVVPDPEPAPNRAP